MRSGLDEVAADKRPFELSIRAAAALAPDAVRAHLGVGRDGLTSAEVAHRQQLVGPNVIAVRRVSAWAILRRQLRSALLLLLVVTAAVSFFVGDRTDAAIIGVILAVSVGLGFVNEYRAELAAQALHTQIRHRAVVRRDGLVEDAHAVARVGRHGDDWRNDDGKLFGRERHRLGLGRRRRRHDWLGRLTLRQRAAHRVTAFALRFEAYIAGMELGNAYTELTDPAIQRSTLGIIGKQA